MLRWPPAPVEFPVLGDEGPAEGFYFWELTFGPMSEEDPRVVKASFGAARHASHEVFLVSAAPFHGFAGLLKKVVLASGTLVPGAVIPLAIDETMFEAVLLAPPGAGSISLAERGYPDRFALRVIPLTAAEAALGERSLDELLAALRAAGALDVTDPLRDCVVAPLTTRRFWAAARHRLLDYVQWKLELRSARLARMIAAKVHELIILNDVRLVKEVRLLLQHIESRPVDPDSPEEQAVALWLSWSAPLQPVAAELQRLADAGAIPDLIRRLWWEIVCITMATHPVARRLLPVAPGQPQLARLDAGEMLDLMVKLFRVGHPNVDPATLLAAGRQSLETARENGAADGGIAAPEVAWRLALTALCLALEDRSTKTGAALGLARRAGVHVADRSLLREDVLTPSERLREVTMTMVLRMTKVLLDELGYEVPSRGPAKRWPETRPAAQEPEEPAWFEKLKSPKKPPTLH